VSPSLVSRIENGERAVSESVLASVARALAVGVSVLRGQPYIQTFRRISWTLSSLRSAPRSMTGTSRRTTPRHRAPSTSSRARCSAFTHCG
ncbi:helix-turn-helix domain-containing protein, partial [Streptomyces sp. NPDC002845]